LKKECSFTWETGRVQLLQSIAGTGSSSPLFVIIFKATEPVQICTAGNCSEDPKGLFSVSLAYTGCFMIHIFVERHLFTDKGIEGGVG